jgi:hypothetical protein
MIFQLYDDKKKVILRNQTSSFEFGFFFQTHYVVGSSIPVLGNGSNPQLPHSYTVLTESTVYGILWLLCLVFPYSHHIYKTPMCVPDIVSIHKISFVLDDFAQM